MVAGTGQENKPLPKNQTTLDLPSDREILIQRTFNGPARIVFEAWTRPELVKLWWAPKSRCVEVSSCDAEVRVGGYYRYVMRLPNGHQLAFSGKYLEVAPPTRLVYTQVFEPAAEGPKDPGVEIVITVTFDERNDRTHVVSHTMCPTSELRDTIMASGMEHGMRETMDLLEELIATLNVDGEAV